ncbi:MAG: DNA repair protein RecN [Opitutales bacterium]
MISTLYIENLALVNKAQVDFERGFSTLTGETGAGKSVLLKAISLLSGGRATKEIIKQGESYCSVQAILYFASCEKIDALLESLGINLCEENTLVISRSIFLDKAAKCTVNGTLTPLSSLAKLGEFWVDFHGAGEPQKLFSTKTQLNLLDKYAHIEDILEQYLNLYKEYDLIAKKIETLLSSEKLSEDEKDYLGTQISNIEALNPSMQSLDELEEKFKLAKFQSEIVENSAGIYNIIEEENGVSMEIAKAYRLSLSLCDCSDLAQQLSDRLNSINIELSDIAQSYQELIDSTSISEEEISAVNEKMALYLSLSRKYGASAENILEALSKMKSKLELHSDVDSSVASLKDDMQKLEAKMKILADKIFDKRLSASKKLEKQTLALLSKLGFKKAKFAIYIEREKGFSINAGSTCEFMFSANAGQELLPLAKVASSGELARVMLALKTSFANADETPLLVFDEVDSNVGGEIGAQVGIELKNLSKEHQVLCVTHLAQVAALADNHYFVDKTQKDDSTSVKISLFERDSKERVLELARMLGDRNSSSAIAHAEVLLQQS